MYLQTGKSVFCCCAAGNGALQRRALIHPARASSTFWHDTGADDSIRCSAITRANRPTLRLSEQAGRSDQPTTSAIGLRRDWPCKAYVRGDDCSATSIVFELPIFVGIAAKKSSPMGTCRASRGFRSLRGSQGRRSAVMSITLHMDVYLNLRPCCMSDSPLGKAQ